MGCWDLGSCDPGSGEGYRSDARSSYGPNTGILLDVESDKTFRAPTDEDGTDGRWSETMFSPVTGARDGVPSLVATS